VTDDIALDDEPAVERTTQPGDQKSRRCRRAAHLWPGTRLQSGCVLASSWTTILCAERGMTASVNAWTRVRAFVGGCCVRVEPPGIYCVSCIIAYETSQADRIVTVDTHGWGFYPLYRRAADEQLKQAWLTANLPSRPRDERTVGSHLTQFLQRRNISQAEKETSGWGVCCLCAYCTRSVWRDFVVWLSCGDCCYCWRLRILVNLF
jgi:hypothetical protein